MIKKASSKAIVAIALLCCLLVSSALFVSGCKDKDSGNSSYTVVYDSQGGAAVKNGTYTVGGKFYLPTPSIGSDPNMYGYTFTGWYYDSECTKKADKTLDTSYAKDGKITLYAGWSNLHKIYFDTRTSQVIDPVEYAYGTTVVTSDLPVPNDRVVGTAKCKFIAWAFSNTNDRVGVSFAMEAVDVYLFAIYDTGVNTRFELDNDGYYIPTGTNGVTTQTRFRDYTLSDGEIYSVDMTLPADWSSYTDDCGPVFTATAFDEAGTTFIGAPYVTMFISAPSKNNGAIEFWGDVDANGSTQSAQLIARYKLGGELLKGTPYEKKMLAYQESNEEATFTLTFRRVEKTVGEKTKVSFYIGIDGVEYVCFTTGERPVRYSEINNVANSVFSEQHTGNIVGLRAKTKAVKYSNISVKKAGDANVKFYTQAGENVLETKSYAYGAKMTDLPLATRTGYVFSGWFYTDYLTGEKKELTAETVVTADMYNIEAVAQWRKEGAKPFTVKFNTGIDGYEVEDVTGWYEGNEILLPVLSYTMKQFDESWYYEAECINVVNFGNIDTTKADIEGADTEEPVLTVYAKATQKEFLEGDGTEENPFLLKTEADLKKFAEFVLDGETLSGYYLKLENDITVNGAYTVIGSRTKPFSGYFDGNGKTITGVNAEGDNYLGMFAVLYGATVKNLTVEGNVTGAKGTNGILAGQVQSGTTIENVTVKGSLTGGAAELGGIAGATFKNGDAKIVIKGCVNYASVNALFSGNNMAGGIVGATVSQLILIENCTNYGKVSGNGTFDGGIVGLFRQCTVDTKVTGCYNYGDVTGGIQVGGIVGGNRYVVENSYVLSTAKINGSEAKDLILDGEANAFVGAIVGRLESTAAKRIGGGLCDEEGEAVAVKITAELDLDGGSYDGETTIELIAESAVLSQLPVPAKAGFRFDRWELVVVKGEGDEQTVNYEKITDGTVFHGPAHTVKLIARYVEQVTVTVNADGGSYDGKTSFVIDKGGKLAEGSLGTPEKEGYTFLGWFNGENRVAADDVYEANTEIVARYEKQAQKSSISFVSDGVTVKTRELDVGTEIGELPVPAAKAGYRFDCWLDVDENAITEKSTFTASTVELHAKWILQTIIAFDAVGGTVNGEATKSIDAGTAIGAMPTATSSVEGEAFGGWVTADGKLVNETTVFGGDVTTITLTASFGWDGVTVANAFVGEGTEESPYALGGGADLAFLANSVNGGEAFSGKYFVLTKNVNLNFKKWTSIGNVAAKPFSGIFDGNGKSITAMNVTGDTYLGLFGVLSGATVKNLTVEGNVTGAKGTNGILAGQVWSGTTIENVTVKGSLTGGAAELGGIAGATFKNGDAIIVIRGCVNYASVNALFLGNNMAGGIVGATVSQLILIENCTNYGKVSGNGTFDGGIVGLFRLCTVDTKVTGCYNYGDVMGKTQVGGIVGGNRYVVENCYVLSTAKINGSEAKDLILDGEASAFVGAIVGRIENTSGSTAAKRIGGGLCDKDGNVVGEN